MKLGFTHDVEVYRLGFVIVFEPSDLDLVEFNQPGVQLLRKIVCLARLPVEAENRLGAALARSDDVVEDLVNRGNVQPNLRERSQQSPIGTNDTEQKKSKYRLDVTRILRRGRQCRPFRRVGGLW
jgi:hypothetical protein